MFRIAAIVIGFAILLGTGVVHGLWTDRWSLSAEPHTSAAKLADVPMNVGEWEGEDLPPPPAQHMVIGEIAAAVNRKYTNRKTGQVMTIMIICGRPGPIAQHPPDVCFGGIGFHAVRTTRTTISEGLSKPASFWAGDFIKADADVPTRLRIFWSWAAAGSGGTWLAPSSSRFTFATYPALYKLYIIHAMGREEETVDEDSARGLILALLPELQRVLFTPAAGSDAAKAAS